MFLLISGIAIALGAAVRSTWSPCGHSMLSQITPVAEAGRGHKFSRTAAWFVAGAIVGGLCLGALMALGAAALRGAGLGHTAPIALVAGFALAAAAVDTGVLGFRPPFLRRQVNEDWLSNYRSWVYGGGFGWQIGFGVATYVMTAAVPLLIIVGVLGASPWAAVSLAVLFGLVRGLAVLLAAPLRTMPALIAFHRRFEAAAEPVRQLVIALQLVVAVSAAWIGAAPLVAVTVTAAAVALVVVGLPRPHPVVAGVVLDLGPAQVLE